jgi:hypothetical protein
LDIVNATPYRTELGPVLLEHIPVDAKKSIGSRIENGRLLKMIKQVVLPQGNKLDISPTMLRVTQDISVMDKDVC